MIKTIRYMGSKRKLIKKIDERIKNRECFIDLMSGSGVVALNVVAKKIVANDIQKYNEILVRGVLHSIDEKEMVKIKKFFDKWNESSFFTKNYSETYFSEKQTIVIDGMFEYAKKLKGEDYYAFKYASIKSMLRVQNTPGHFAAYLKDGERSRKLKSLDLRTILLEELSKGRKNEKNLITFSKNSLEIMNIKNATYYLDPPYTSEQYSRFYHFLETFASFEMPIIMNNKGRYPEGRFKSNFSYKNKAIKEFEKYIKQAHKMESDLIISYSNKSLVEYKEILKLLKKYYGEKVFLEIIDFNHSSMGSNKKEVEEILMGGYYVE